MLNCNDAVLKTDAEIVVLLNSDCEISDNFAENILKCFDSDPNIIAASPIASNSASYYIPQFLPLPLMNFFLNKNLPQYPEVFNAEGFCFCVRKSYIDEYGLFDPVYGKGYCEEVDFCLRAKSNGKKCVLIDNLYVKHKRNKSFGTDKNKYLSINNKIMFSRWGEMFSIKAEQRRVNPIKDITKKSFGIFSFIPRKIIKFNKRNFSNRVKTITRYFKFKQPVNKNAKSIIYTCISGDCDIIPIIQTYYSPDRRYICFTDNRTLINMKYFGMWEIRPLAFNELDGIRNARWHKMHPHILFPDCNESIWIDANIDILTPYLFEEIRVKDLPLLVPLHYCRKSVYSELKAVKCLKRDQEDIVDKIQNYIREKGMPENYGLNETNIIYRKHNVDKIKTLMDDWWEMIAKFSKRDQLSFSYVLWKNNIRVEDISIDNARIDPLNFRIYSHKLTNTIIGKFLSLIFHK